MANEALSPDVLELTQTLRRLVGQAHRLTQSINETVEDLGDYQGRALRAVDPRERRSPYLAHYQGAERRRG